MQFYYYLCDLFRGVLFGDPDKVQRAQWAWEKRTTGLRFKYLCLDQEGYVWPERSAYLAMMAEEMAIRCGARVADADTPNYELMIEGKYSSLNRLLSMVEETSKNGGQIPA